MPFWFRLIRVRSPLLAESLLFSLPPGTEMVHFPGFASPPYFIQTEIHEFCSCGFPHSEICGSKDDCSSPQLFAACHVLHRLEVPRHPPCALSSLTIKFTHEQQTNFDLGALHFDLSLIVNRGNFTDACTVKLALCVSLLSDVTLCNLRSKIQISNCSHNIGQQSLFDFQRTKTTFDQVSKLQRLMT
jgi:hypothetical protein